jgi:hypothetical protein
MVAQIRRQLSLRFLRLRPTGVDYDLGGRLFGPLCLCRSTVCSLGSERISYALYCFLSIVIRFRLLSCYSSIFVLLYVVGFLFYLDCFVILDIVCVVI